MPRGSKKTRAGVAGRIARSDLGDALKACLLCGALQRLTLLAVLMSISPTYFSVETCIESTATIGINIMEA